MVTWETTTIGELLEFKNGLNKGKEFFGQGTPIVNYMDVYKNRGIHAEQLRGRVTLSAEEIKRFDVRKGDVFFTRTSETPDEVGFASVMLDDVDDCVFSGFVLRGRPITDSLDIGYCQYAFMTKDIRKAIMSGCTYTTRALTNGRQLSSIEIQLPEKSEQRIIATALSDADSYIASLEKLITKKRAVKHGAMQELLTGKRRLPGFKGEWVEKQLGEIGEVRMCKRIFAQQTTASGDIPFYKIGTFGKQPDAYISRVLYEEYVNKYPYPNKGDVLLSAAGTIGRTVVFNGISSYYQDSNIVWLEIDKSEICNDYLYHYYQVIEWASPEGSTISRLYNGIIKATIIKLPPTLAEQIAISNVLSDMDSEIDVLTAKLEKARRIKQGMMNELLTGKIRLIGEDTENGEN